MATFAELRAEVRDNLQDPDGVRWTDAELDRNLNRAQKEIARRTGVLRSQTALTIRENQAVYHLPDDAIDILRIERDDGLEVDATTSLDLQRQHGDNFRTTTGAPTRHYSDLDGGRALRFYPRPSPTVEVAPIEFRLSCFQYRNVAISSTVDGAGSISRIDRLQDRLVISDDTNLVFYDKSFNIEKTVAHGIAGVSDQVYPVFKTAGDGAINWSGESYIIDNNGNDILEITKAGAVSTLASDGGSIDNCLGFDARTGSLFYTVSGSTKTCSSSGTLATYIAVQAWQLASVHTAPPAFTIVNYLACQANGVYKDTAQISTENVGGIVILDDGTIYVNHNGTLATMDSSGTITDTTITGLHAKSTLTTDGTRIWAKTTSSTVIEVKDNVTTDTYLSIQSFGTATADDPFAWIGYNGVLYSMWYLGCVNTNLFQLATTDRELGGAVLVDTITADSEFGFVMDIEDDTDTIVFEDDFGCITQIIVDTEQYTIFYTRDPVEGIVEVEEDDALIYFATARAFAKESDDGSIREEARWMAKYSQILSRINRTVSGQFNNGDHGVVSQFM